MAWSKILLTVLIASLSLDTRLAFAECQFNDTTSKGAITYRFSLEEAPSGRQLAITTAFRAEAGRPTVVSVPSDLISDLHIVGSKGDLQRDSSGQTTVSIAKSGVVSLSYLLRNGWSGPLIQPHQFQPVILSQYAEVTGDKALVWRKDDQQATVTVNFDWQALPPTWALATSFGVASPVTTGRSEETTSAHRERCQTYTGPWTRVNQALFAAGDFRLHPFKIGPKPGILAVRGNWAFSDAEAAEEIGNTVRLVRDFWHDDAFPFFLVTLQPFDQDHGSSDGTAFTDAFWMYVSRKDNINGLLSQLAHESFHAWNPLKMGYLSIIENEKIKWFKEGFTEYYAQKLTYAGGERSAQQVVTSTNRDLLAFSSSTNEYVRGRVIALWLDATIKEHSQSQHSLDDVMFRLVRGRKQPLTEERIYAAIQPYISVAQLSALKKAADQGGDLSLPTTIPGLGNCYHAVYGEFPTFNLGLDFTKSRAAKMILGLDPSGPAYKAGLRNGQPLVAWDIDRGNTERQATVTLQIDGQERKISFSPRGAPKMAWQYLLEDGKSCSASG